MTESKLFVLCVLFIGLSYIQSVYVAPPSEKWCMFANCFPCLQRNPRHIHELDSFVYNHDVYSNAFIYWLKNPPKDAPADVDWFEIRARKDGECGFTSLLIFSGKSVEITYLSGPMITLVPYDDSSELRLLLFERDEYAINFANDLIKANKDEIDKNVERTPLERIDRISNKGTPNLLIYDAVIVTRFLPDDSVKFYLRGSVDDRTWAILSSRQFTVQRVSSTEINMKSIISQIDDEIYVLVFDSPAASDKFLEKAEELQNLIHAQNEVLRKWKIYDDPVAAAERAQRAKFKPLKIYDASDKARGEELESLVEKEKNIEMYYPDDKGKGKAVVVEEYESKMKAIASQYTSGG